MNFFKNLTDHVRTFNSNILLVDGMNTFIRGMSVSKICNDNGMPIGGYSGFLLSLGYVIKKLKPTRCIIVFDGVNGSIQRKEIYSEYKANRTNKREKPRNPIYQTAEFEDHSMKIQLERLIQYLKLFPVHIVMIDHAEADDVIANICHMFPNSKKHIMSTDQDFYQLINKKTLVYSPTKKIIIDEKYIKENFGMSPKNFIMHKVFNGDKSDNVPGIKGAGLKTLQKRLPILFKENKVTISELYGQLNDEEVQKYKVLQEIKNKKEDVERNFKIMQLEEPLLTEDQKNEIKTIIKQPVPRLNAFSFLKYSAVDGLEAALKNTQSWVNNVFSHLTNYENI